MRAAVCGPSRKVGRVKIIVGLGNPGRRYRNTRHNVGFRVVERLAARLGADFGREKYGGLVAEAVHRGHRLLLLKPLTYMNESGRCVARAVRYRAVAPDELLVVVDDVNLPVGKLRLRSQGSAGGHNGLKSIAQHLGGHGFSRLRLGVGRQRVGAGLTDHVLGSFASEERAPVEDMVERAVDALLCVLADGLQQTMNDFN